MSEVDRLASEISHDIAEFLNKRVDFPTLDEAQEEALLTRCVAIAERFVIDRTTDGICRWLILFSVNFGLIVIGKSLNII